MSSRKALVKLACLERNDRAWILKSLTLSERKIVEKKLEEIESLGLNKDASIIQLLESEQKSASEKPILPSELLGVTEIERLPRAWQIVLLECMGESDRNFFSKKYNIFINENDRPGKVPPEFRKSLLASLKRQDDL